MKEARKARDRYHKNKDDENYRFWRNKVTTLIKQAKTNYYESAFKENKTSDDIWRHIKELNPKPLKKKMEKLHRKYVFAPADKAANNVIIIRERHYVEVLKGELNSTSTYVPTS